MRHPTPKSARPDNAESRPDARTDIVLAISEALAGPSDALAGLNSILDRAGYSKEDVRSTFESVDDLVVAIAERKAFLISRPLAVRACTLDHARDICPDKLPDCYEHHIKNEKWDLAADTLEAHAKLLNYEDELPRIFEN